MSSVDPLLLTTAHTYALFLPFFFTHTHTRARACTALFFFFVSFFAVCAGTKRWRWPPPWPRNKFRLSAGNTDSSLSSGAPPFFPFFGLWRQQTMPPAVCVYLFLHNPPRSRSLPLSHCFSGEYEKAATMFRRGLDGAVEGTDHHLKCVGGVARNAIRLGSIPEGKRLAAESGTKTPRCA